MTGVGRPGWVYVVIAIVLLLSLPISAQAPQAGDGDSDGDRLHDSWKDCGTAPNDVPLRDSEPGRMALYVQIQYAEGIVPLTPAEKRQLERHWAEMPVRNPDGTTGIDLHVDDEPPLGGRVDERISLDGSMDDLEEQSRTLRERYYAAEHMGDRPGVYHQLILGEIPADDIGGLGNTPGMFAIVDGTHLGGEDGATPRVRLITHELLHNVVGRIDPQHRTGEGDAHTDEGWLAVDVADNPEDAYLPEGIASQLERRGFADQATYAAVRPDESVDC